MLTNFQVSKKTARPGCCNFDCCGNHFGRIARNASYHAQNRIIKARRYAKHVEKQAWKKEIQNELD